MANLTPAEKSEFADLLEYAQHQVEDERCREWVVSHEPKAPTKLHLICTAFFEKARNPLFDEDFLVPVVPRRRFRKPSATVCLGKYRAKTEAQESAGGLYWKVSHAARPKKQAAPEIRYAPSTARHCFCRGSPCRLARKKRRDRDALPRSQDPPDDRRSRQKSKRFKQIKEIKQSNVCREGERGREPAASR